MISYNINFFSQKRIEKKIPLLQTLPRKTFLSICFCLSREGERASPHDSLPRLVLVVLRDLDTTSGALVWESLSRKKEQNSTIQNTQTWQDKDKWFFSES